MKNLIEAKEAFSKLNEEERKDLILLLLVEGKIKYESLSEAYVTYLEYLSNKKDSDIRDLSANVLNLILYDKKSVDRDKVLETSYDLLCKTRMFNDTGVRDIIDKKLKQ